MSVRNRDYSRLTFSICLTNFDPLLSDSSLYGTIEKLGFHALFLPENSHVPVDRSKTLKKDVDPSRIRGFCDPFPVLSSCAVATKNLKLGTSVTLLTQRDARFLARSVSSLQFFSNNRFILGVAGGFIREAMENHGSSFTARWSIVKNAVLTMKSDWQRAKGMGEGFDVPPIFIGSNSSHVPLRVAEYADGWMLRKEMYKGNALDDLKKACLNIGRPYSSVKVILMGAPHDKVQIEKEINYGISNFLFFTPGHEMTQLLDELHRLGEIVGAFKKVA
ncbi:MAG: LLM class flavin-dependent oxidoreductase [Pseudomonadota bacterium]|nr:LLM class flavin-dependent oxidoreductase [Pseudomonadota bacterium]